MPPNTRRRPPGWRQALGWFAVLAALLLGASWALRQADRPLIRAADPAPTASRVQAPAPSVRPPEASAPAPLAVPVP
ncbi:MAG: glycerophosphodiester phosphodiesterase, partial [Ottowia sp.]|nr:glycerophosphodiester phosphodiesterase [Ottowia sp.]